MTDDAVLCSLSNFSGPALSFLQAHEPHQQHLVNNKCSTMPPCISTVITGSSQNPQVVSDPDIINSGASGNEGGADLAPVVLVGGFLLPPTTDFDAIYWGEALTCRENGGRVIPVHPSPIASLHDR
jgi:hypothetical protein